MKYIQQHDERDCGAACLSMIASHYGLKYSISKYRELTKTDQNGTNLYGLCDAAQKIGFNAEALSGNIDTLLEAIDKADIKFPFIAHIINEDYMQHFVVVLNIKNGKFTIADPAKGKIKYTIAQFAELWTGYVAVFEKNEHFRKGDHTKGSFRKFFTLLHGQYSKLATVIFLSLIISLVGIAGSFVFEVIIDDFYLANEYEVCGDDCTDNHEHITEASSTETNNIIDKIISFITNNASNFNLFFICLIGLYILQAIIQFIRGYLICLVSKKIDMRLMVPYFDHIVDLPMSAVNTRKTGEYLSRFSDADAVRSAVSGAVLTLILDSFMVITAAIILYTENALLFYISLVIIALYTVIVICYKKPIENINREEMENNARTQSFLKESIDGIETVKANRIEDFVKTKNSHNFSKYIKAVFKNNVVSISQDSLCNFVELIGTVVILWVGFGLVIANEVSIGSLITFYALLAYFTEPIKNLIGLQPMMQTAVIAAERLNDILDIPVEEKVQYNTDIAFNNIVFSNIDFRYGNHDLVLKNVSFDIKKGEKVAIVGESGCGKTTLAKLLLKFYKAENGIISIDGNELSHISTETIRNSISYIDQNTFLFSDTVKNNLIFGNRLNLTDDYIQNICKTTKADEFIQDLPFGYDSFLDENGKNLSGGQRQRLAIARALLRKPKLIIFDEATSNLDTITENAIKETIFNLNKDMTCIIIAHRLTTIQNCDKIVVMKNGEIVEIGTHQELMDERGAYFELYRKQ
ncbi:MAG: peptidase domain-containing ABC transporter [Clostridia bacterium]|nr:peptidase domain-containing ABC transporter [Clostridia bacterium]